MGKAVFDWEQVFTEGIIPKLYHLRNHIATHQLHEGWEQDVAEIDGAIAIWRFYRHGIWKQSGASWGVEGDVFDALMDYLKYHMRKWWD